MAAGTICRKPLPGAAGSCSPVRGPAVFFGALPEAWPDAVSRKIDSGNISVLLISENFIKESREKGNYGDIDLVMSHAESLKAQITIIASDDPMRKLDGLGGIACLLRWKENY